MEEAPLGGLAESLLTVAEAAKYLGVSTRSIYKMIHHSVDPLLVMRRNPYLIRKSDLDGRQVKRKK